MAWTIRVTSRLGTWKLRVEPSSRVSELQERIAAQYSVPVEAQRLSRAGQRGGADGPVLAASSTLAALGLEHGSKLFLEWDGEAVVIARSATKKTIDAQGNIVDLEYEAEAAEKGFRPGMLALKNMKMQWTLAEFQELDSKFVYEFKDIKAGKAFDAATAVCPKVSIDTSCLESFQRFVAQFQYKRARCGFLYGSRAADGAITVEAIYEPPQTFALPTRLRALADHEPQSRSEMRLVAGHVYFGDELDRTSGTWRSRLVCTVTFHANHAHNLTRSP
jgi:nuclear protein localization family protein 4